MYSVETDNNKTINVMKWVVGVFFLVAAVALNVVYAFAPLLYRVFGIVLLFLFAGVTLSQTTQGKTFINFIVMAKNELMKVVWPTRNETVQMTIMVIVVVIAVSFFLMDSR